MSTPSNLYAEKLLSEHPLALWSLDGEAEYISLISESTRDLTTWQKTGGTATASSDATAPFPSSYITKIVGTETPTQNVNGVTYLTSNQTFTSAAAGFTVAFYIKTTTPVFLSAGFGTGAIRSISSVAWNASYLEFTTSSSHGFAAGDYVQIVGVTPDLYDTVGYISATGLTSTKFRIYGTYTDSGSGSGGTAQNGKTQTQYIQPTHYPLNTWIPVSFTFEEALTSKSLLITLAYGNASPEYYINGLTLGQDSEKFNGESFGQSLSTIPSTISTSVTNGIETKAYNDDKYSAYYIGSGNVLYAKTALMPMSYGSVNIMTVYPNATANQPSFIMPGFGFLNEIGRYKELTIEALLRINVNTTTPKRIFGPLASSDGLYVTNEFVTLKVGDSIGTYYVSELYKPMLFQIQIGDGYANLSIDGDNVISLQIDNASLTLPSEFDGSSKSQDWLGFYAYATSVPSVEVDSIAVYPYRCGETLAKRRFIYAQGVSLPENFNTSYNGKTVLLDYLYSNYTNNYNYPRTDAKWEQAINVDNFNVEGRENLSPNTYNTPDVVNTAYSNSVWLQDLYATNVASGESNTFINLEPSTVVSGSGRSWSSNTGYLSLNSYNASANLSSCFYGVFKSVENSASEQILIKVENNINGDYVKISLTGTTVSYLFKYQGVSEVSLATKTIVTGTTFAVGMDIEKLISGNGNLASFFANKSSLNFYIGGDTTLLETFSGNIYKVGLCSKRNSADITSLFDSAGILSNSSVFASLLSRTATYTVVANNIYSKIVLDIAVNSYWENYVPLSKLAKTFTDSNGVDTYGIDLLQFNFDYPEPKIFSGSNYDTSNSMIKTYVSFQTILSGATPLPSSFTTTVAPNSNNVVSATTFSATTRYQVVNNMVIYPPTNVDIQTLALVFHVEATVPGINTNPVSIRYLQVAAQSFNANTPNPLGTRYSTDIYPYTETSGVFNYKTQNPYLIYKDSTPYLYLTRYSGIKIAGTYSSSVDRGVYINISEPTSDTRISSVQMSIFADFKEFPSSQMDVLRIESNSGSVRFTIRSINTAKDKGIISLITSDTNTKKPVFFLNGKKVTNPIISLNEWNMIGIAFATPIDMTNSVGRIKLSSTMLVNNISFYKANPVEIDQKATQLLWSDVDGNNWGIPIPTQTPTVSGSTITLNTTGNHNLALGEIVDVRDVLPDQFRTQFFGQSVVTAKTDTSFTYVKASATSYATPITTAGIVLGAWDYASIPNYYGIYGNNLKEIYKTYTGTNKSIFDFDYSRQGFKLGGYEYLAYLDVKINETLLDIL
jgi:hypothetical protein